MRRGTEFVLEQASWPALLLEEDGRIRRANQAARRVFALEKPDADLALIWSKSNSVSPAEFLAGKAGAAELKLRAAGDVEAPFFAQLANVQRDGERYLVLQLFKQAGAAFPELAYAPPPKEPVHTAPPPLPASPAPPPAHPPPPAAAKVPEPVPEEEFVLQNAEWPAIVVNKHGKIMRGNRAAIRAFGPALEEQGSIEKIWAPGNADSALQFLSLPTADKPPAIKFHLKSGLPATYLTQLCATANDEVCLLQLFPEPAAETPKAAVQSVEANLAHKQKLDCALQLARSVSLDFNNALTSILGHASLLLSKSEPGHPWRSSLAEIEKSAAKAAEIANDLAAFSRQEKDVRGQAAGNLNNLLERTVDVFQANLRAPINISRQFERKLFTANFDEAKMQQALVKILENAVESIKGQGKITVQTRNMESSEPIQDGTAKLNAGNYVCAEITDSGSGIAADVLPRIFEPFFTTKGTRHRGLGLAWVYGIVTNHAGGVAVSCPSGGGTSVRLYLPATGRIARETPVAPADLSGTQTILLVDDEDLLLTMGQMVLSSFGYTVLTANSGAKALEIFSKSKQRVDLVITDLVMPNMSGRELTEQILKLAPGTRILWSSGYVRSGDTQDFDRYLQKPFTSQDLLRKVKQVLST